MPSSLPTPAAMYAQSARIVARTELAMRHIVNRLDPDDRAYRADADALQLAYDNWLFSYRQMKDAYAYMEDHND